MYEVSVQYFNNAGYCLGKDVVFSPGVEMRALMAYIKEYAQRDFCGVSPAYIYATPAAGEPVLVIMGGLL